MSISTQTCWKERYVTHGDAQKAAQRQRVPGVPGEDGRSWKPGRTRRKFKPQRAYRCSDCGGWHLTSAPRFRGGTNR